MSTISEHPQESEIQLSITSTHQRKTFTAIMLVGLSVATAAHAQPPEVVQFEGQERVSSSDGTLIPGISPFTGSFSYDSAAPVVDQEGSRTTYFDAGGSLHFEFNGVSLRSVGGISLSTSRVPLVGYSTFNVSADWVAVDGSSQEVESMSVLFLATGSFFLGSGLPTNIELSRAGGFVSISSLDLPTTDDAPPRSGAFSGQLTSYSQATPCVASDVRMDWLNQIAASVRVFPPVLFAGDDEAEQAITRSRVALLIDKSALGIANCDNESARDTLIELAESIADPANPQVVSYDFAIALIEPIFAILLSL